MATDGMVEALIAKASRMRKLPKWSCGEWNTVPGRMYVAPDTYFDVTEDVLWPKVDKLIVKGLRILSDDGEGQPMNVLLERVLKLGHGKGEESVEFLVGARVLSDMRLKHAFRHLIRCRKEGCADAEYAVFYGCNVERSMSNVAEALMFRGLMKRKKGSR